MHVQRPRPASFLSLTRLPVLGTLAAGLLLATACTTGGQPSPTTAPAKPAGAPTTAPAAASPVGSPAATKPAASPGASPAAKPAAKPAASPAAGGAAPAMLPVPAVTDAQRSAAENFFRGKTIKIVVGFTPGGGFDTVGRAVARYIGKYIPGNPNVIVENQPGASGKVAINAVYNTAPKDGTTLLVFPEPSLQAQYLGEEGVQFDARKLTWLGSTQSATQVCVVRTDTGITSFKDIQGAGAKSIKVGTTGKGSNLHDFPAMLKGNLGANIELVAGYPGSNDARLAMERGETNGVCLPWESLKVGSAAWFQGANQFARVIIQQGAEKNPDLANVPMAIELAGTPQQKQIVTATTGSLAVSKPLAGPPGIPDDRAVVLRAAFAQTMNDPEMRAEAERTKLDLFPRGADDVQRIVNDILNVSPEAVAEIKQILAAD